MNEGQYARLAMGMPKRISLENLEDRSPRTLVYGYTCSRDTWHVYLNEEGKFVWVMYDHDGFLIDSSITDDVAPRDCVPNKRIYPAKSDFEFCLRLMHSGEELPFTTFEPAEPLQFYGKRLEELVAVSQENFEVTVPLEWEDLGASAALSNIVTGEYTRNLVLEAATKVIEGQTEGYLRSHFKGAPRDGWLTVIPTGIESAVRNATKRNYPWVSDDFEYAMSEETKCSLMTRVRAAIDEKLAFVQAA